MKGIKGKKGRRETEAGKPCLESYLISPARPGTVTMTNLHYNYTIIIIDKVVEAKALLIYDL